MDEQLNLLNTQYSNSSDAGYADLPLALLGAPVDIGALVKTWVGPVTHSRVPDREEKGKPINDVRRGRCHPLE